MIDGATVRAAGAILASFAIALALTLAVELVVAGLAFHMRTRRELGIVALANAITNPTLNLALMLVAAVTGSITYDGRMARHLPAVRPQDKPLP